VAATGAGGPRRGGLRGIGCNVIGVFLFCVADALVKWLSEGYPTMQLVFFSGAIGLVTATALAYRQSGPGALRTRRPWVHVGRGVLIFGSMASFFFALRHLPLADVTAVSYTSPLWIALLAVPVLGEPLGWRRIGAVLVGFGGVLLIARPGGTDAHAALLIALLNAVFYALAMLSTRRFRAHETPAAMMFYMHAVIAVLALVTLPWFWRTPGPADLALLLALGGLNGVGHFFVMQAYRLAPAAAIAPFDYTALVWAALIGLLVWGEFPNAWVLAGIGLIVVATLTVARAESRAP
jgi:drug/metabolite transporter (DMT)-like permease